jgi:disulfide bond formation protein DsbB
MPIETINYTLALGTVAMQIVAVVLIAVYVTRARYVWAASLYTLTARWGIWVAFLLSLAGIALTLFYSEVVGYVPCGLCWLVRVFLYPQAFLYGVALWQKRVDVTDYALSLAIPGAIVALYKHYLEMGGGEILPCPASGVGECARRYVFEFNYMTLPLMGFTVLVFLVILMFIVRGSRR